MNRPIAPSKPEIAELPPFPVITLERVKLVVTGHDAEEALFAMRSSRVLGFDTESKPTFNKGDVSTGPHVLQFATDARVYVFQSFRNESTAAIRAILIDPTVAKVGFGLNDDISRVSEKFALEPQNVVDLGRTFRRMGYHNTIGAKSAIAILFQQRVSKSKSISTTNWSNQNLTEKQIIYAANDAHIALCAFRELERLGLAT
jgi:RNA polymerase sigma factor for flagellar operon FliA